MSTQFVIWERNRRAFVGGSTPAVFPSSSDANTFVVRVTKHEKQQTPSASYDVISVTTNP
jgi:hypothetical protein